MGDESDSWVRQPLIAARPPSSNRGIRVLLLLAWLATTGWLAWHHVPWRDEVRAWSLTLMASNLFDLFRVVHGEGHPHLWYVLLRAGHELFGVREVLPALGLAISVAAAALLALKSPFRIGIIALLLFSQHLGFEYSVVSRNYGLSALILFVIAASYQRAKDGPWFGFLLLLLCNSNAPSVFVAGALYLYRMVEVWLERPALRSRTTAMLVANGVLLSVGVLLCFLAIYPPVNDAAAAANRVPFSAANLLASLFDAERSFGALGFDNALFAANIFMVLALLAFLRSKPAIIAAVAAFLTLKTFFFFAFPAAYRHAALFLMFLVALLWIEAGKRGARTGGQVAGAGTLALVAAWGLVGLLAIQTILYLRWPVTATIEGRPWSHAADLAALAAQPENAGAVMIFDPDTLGESAVYFSNQPFWLMRQGRPGTLAAFSSTGRRHLGLDDFIAAAATLHGTSGRPILIVLQRDLKTVAPGRYDVMYGDTTTYTRANIDRFRTQTRQVGSFRRAYGDEKYDVYRYPR
ncbi:hypothetical protein [Sphingomonas glaciei]|uniref:Glycosyltransferase RgtA/B/C/D-like domain-containing protein n=1 Tax=Sphingomonas glaciei TaxID=2938948 RepID=A0ABY5N0R2_9SPHN|nr:hypothetical protein [Sphingomonas glaciei]UUR08191.1 hypothetical protein M1K48_00650 [Sphingomonas glaciei]